ncbi:MAG: ASCH domain-containing protein [Limnohabitans sp.]
MKALTLTQPWATLVIAGTKQYETRGWHTDYRGTIAIHAAKGQDPRSADFARYLRDKGVLDRAYQPRGFVLGTVTLSGCYRTQDLWPESLEREIGDWTPGRWAWSLDHAVRFDEPVPARGALGLWTWNGLP